MTKIAIIGTGLAGLTLAQLLRDKAEIDIFEKARGVGGRMSTRRAEPYFFDHGAQYFTARTTEFQDFLQPYIDQGIICQWHARYAMFDGYQMIEQHLWRNQEPRYIAMPAMNMLAKTMAKPFNINLSTRITNITTQESKWRLYDNTGAMYEEYDWVISTAPSPQTASLFPTSFKYHSTIGDIKMRGCFAVMLGFEHPLSLAFDAAHIKNSDISWLAANHAKPERKGKTSLIIHASPDYTESYIDHDHEEVMKHLTSEASLITGVDLTTANHHAIHPWRYAHNDQQVSHDIFIDPNSKLAACGDWCQDGRVEGAFTSAYHLAHALKKELPS